MNKNYWNRVALTYEDEIFDVFRNNKGQKLQKYLRKHANKNKKAIDFGCGVGKAFRYLSPAYKSVLGVDISENCIRASKQVVKTNNYKNIRLRQMDLSKSKLNLPPCDFASCVNVAMLPELEKNEAIIGNIYKTLTKSGTAVFVVPSLESKLFTAQQLIRWHQKDGIKAREIPDPEFSHISKNRRATLQGLIKIDTETTKHYLHVEILSLFTDLGFDVTSIEKLEYGWHTEFESPPEWMQEPGPWDWLIEAQKARVVKKGKFFS